MSEAQRRRITFGIILTIVGGIWSAAGIGTAMRVQDTWVWAFFGVFVLLVGLGLIARYFVVRSQTTKSPTQPEG